MPKTQTTSPTTARLQCNLPRWSALWAQQCSRPRPHRHQSGGITLHEGSTRRRHAARRLRVVQNPHHHLHGEHQGYGGPGRSACERQKPGNRTQGRPHFRYKTLPAHPPSPHIRYKTLPAHPPSPHIRYKTLPAHPTSPHVRDKTLPARPKWLNLALFLHAGRVLYRTRGRVGASHNSTPGTGGTTRPGRGAGCGRLAGPARVRRATARQISHAIPPRHDPTQAQKPQNIND